MKMYAFPKDFLWGASTAAHQVEGNNINSDWWDWEQKEPGRLKSGVACDNYHLYKSDFALAKNLGHNSHRLSIEWARIEPKKGHFDQNEIKHYQNVLKELKRLKMKSFVTLWHFTLPKWFLDDGGFEKRSNIKYFERYTKLCTEKFGSLVDYWVTVNEPSNYTMKAYLLGWWPPQKKSFLSALRVYLNIALAHKKSQEIIHKKVPGSKVSFAHQLISYYPAKKSIPDYLATLIMNFFANDLFLICAGTDHDYFGLNYYFHNPTSFKYLFMKIPDNDLIKTLSDDAAKYGWGMSPKGFYRVIKKAWKEKKPIYVLENGIADSLDKTRKNRLVGHIKEMVRAMNEGVDVRSYLHWSLMDNYEWQFGFVPKFGLCKTVYKSQKRIPRQSAFVFSKIAKENAI